MPAGFVYFATDLHMRIYDLNIFALHPSIFRILSFLVQNSVLPELECGIRNGRILNLEGTTNFVFPISLIPCSEFRFAWVGIRNKEWRSYEYGGALTLHTSQFSHSLFRILQDETWNWRTNT